MITAAWITLFAPAVAVALLAAAGNRVSGRQAGLVATGSVLVSFVCSAIVFATLLGESPEERAHASTLWTWLNAGSFTAGFDIYIDQLSVFMMLIVSGVGFLILAYATGYIRGDEEERRYHAYKALFVFSMLLLVMSGNLLLLLAGWGMVGLSSYLLINFWWRRESAVAAGKKAFIVNAFGDATFVLALFLIVQHVGGLELGTVFAGAEEALEPGSAVAVLIALGLLGGAVAKSAQVPLHTWLPDAMEGPTPVSALIHAATMVTAGVYLIARTHVVLRARRGRARHGGGARRGHDRRGRPRRARADRHQARDRLLDHEPDRLHVRRGRPRGLRAGHVPPDDARLLQGAPLHDGRRDHPRADGRAGHPQDGRASPASSRGRTASSSSARSRSQRSHPSRASSRRTRSCRARSTRGPSGSRCGSSGSSAPS